MVFQRASQPGGIHQAAEGAGGQVELDSDCRLRPILAALTIALRPNPRMNRSAMIWPRHDQASAPARRADIAESYRGEHRHREVQGVRARESWLKFPVPNVDIVKYVEANRTRKSGTVAASASIARMPGNSDLMIRWISQTTTAMNKIIHPPPRAATRRTPTPRRPARCKSSVTARPPSGATAAERSR